MRLEGNGLDELRKARLEQLVSALDAFVDAMRFSARGEGIWRYWSYRELSNGERWPPCGKLPLNSIPVRPPESTKPR